MPHASPHYYNYYFKHYLSISTPFTICMYSTLWSMYLTVSRKQQYLYNSVSCFDCAIASTFPSQECQFVVAGSTSLSSPSLYAKSWPKLYPLLWNEIHKSYDLLRSQHWLPEFDYPRRWNKLPRLSYKDIHPHCLHRKELKVYSQWLSNLWV